MNKFDIIECLARHNAKSFRPMREEEASEVEIPYFVLKKNAMRTAYDVTMHNFERHDNAPRMPFICDFLKQHVFPNVEDADISGVYPIELHDTYTYLSKDTMHRYKNALVFAKDAGDANPCLMPDPYMLSYYGGRLNVKDEVPFQDKVSKIVFRGVSTGTPVPTQNPRINLCQWGNKQAADITDFGISGIVQMDPDVVRSQVEGLDALMRPPMSQPDHYKYKYILSMDGNTASWDRMLWVAASKSMLMKYTSRQMLWYYPLIMEDQHFVGVDTNNMRSKFNFCEANPNYCRFITANANNFVSQFITPLTPMLYLKALLEEASENKA